MTAGSRVSAPPESHPAQKDATAVSGSAVGAPVTAAMSVSFACPAPAIPTSWATGRTWGRWPGADADLDGSGALSGGRSRLSVVERKVGNDMAEDVAALFAAAELDRQLGNH